MHLVDVGEQGTEVVLGGDEQPGMDAAGALGPQPDLCRGFLARDDQRTLATARGEAVGHLEQQGGLAYAWLTGQQDDRTRHQPAAEDPVEFGHPGGTGAGDVGIQLADRAGSPGDGAGRDGASGRGAGLGHGAPGLALGATADPAKGEAAAVGAAEAGLAGGARLGHMATLAPGYDTAIRPRRSNSAAQS